MPDNQTSFEDLPILSELRGELSRAFSAHEATAATAAHEATAATAAHEATAATAAHEATAATARARRQRRRSPRLRPLAGIPLVARPAALIGAGAGIAAAAIAAILLASSTTQPAYALTRHANGSITVTIHQIEAAVPALNARFKAMGIDETVVPVEASCPTSKSPADMLFVSPPATVSETITLTPGRKHLAPGYAGVLAAEQLSNGKVALAEEAVQPPVPSCFSKTAYTLRRTGTMPNGSPIYTPTPVIPKTTSASGK